jgi:hypothetical protein
MTGSTTPTAPRRNIWLIVGVIVLAVLAGILLTLVLTRSPQTASTSPSANPSTSASESQLASPSESPAASEELSEQPAPSDDPGPTPVVEAPEGVLPPGSVARVVVDSLNVRMEPSTDADAAFTLGRDDLVVLGFSTLNSSFGPIDADGFSWYPVNALGVTELPEPGNAPLESQDFGWMAVSDGSDTFVELVAPRCTDDEPSLELLQSLTDWERLSCYGDRSITIEGTYGCGGCGGLYPGTFEPPWLASPLNFNLLSVDASERIGPFAMRFAPEGPEFPEAASILSVTGHFDDPAAVGCVVAPLDAPDGIDTAVAELYCREQFVVDSYEVLGVDENFPFG